MRKLEMRSATNFFHTVYDELFLEGERYRNVSYCFKWRILACVAWELVLWSSMNIWHIFFAVNLILPFRYVKVILLLTVYDQKKFEIHMSEQRMLRISRKRAWLHWDQEAWIRRKCKTNFVFYL